MAIFLAYSGQKVDKYSDNEPETQEYVIFIEQTVDQNTRQGDDNPS